MNFCTEFNKAQVLPCEYRKIEFERGTRLFQIKSNYSNEIPKLCSFFFQIAINNYHFLPAFHLVIVCILFDMHFDLVTARL